jgi:hypothetical protein
MDTRRTTWLLLGFITISTPLALAVETFLRSIMFPPEFEEVRMYLRPSLEVPVWSLLALVALTTYVGIRRMEGRIERRMAKRPESEQTQHYRDKDTLDAIVIFTSLPQVPAIMATFCFMFGARLTPVLVNMAVATLGVLLVGLHGMKIGAQSRNA